jgi:PPP family 3-phenylpropionic acid transporter
VIRWTAAGISPATTSVLWSEAVAAAVVVFFLIGPALIARLTPRGALANAVDGKVALVDGGDLQHAGPFGR